MPQGKARTRAIEVDYFSLEDPGDLTECLEVLAEQGYTGAVTAHKHRNPDGSEEMIWGIMLTAPDAAQLGPVNIGSVVIWTGRTLEEMPRSEFDDKYDVRTRRRLVSREDQIREPENDDAAATYVPVAGGVPSPALGWWAVPHHIAAAELDPTAIARLAVVLEAPAVAGITSSADVGETHYADAGAEIAPVSDAELVAVLEAGAATGITSTAAPGTLAEALIAPVAPAELAPVLSAPAAPAVVAAADLAAVLAAAASTGITSSADVGEVVNPAIIHIPNPNFDTTWIGWYLGAGWRHNPAVGDPAPGALSLNLEQTAVSHAASSARVPIEPGSIIDISARVSWTNAPPGTILRFLWSGFNTDVPDPAWPASSEVPGSRIDATGSSGGWVDIRGTVVAQTAQPFMGFAFRVDSAIAAGGDVSLDTVRVMASPAKLAAPAATGITATAEAGAFQAFTETDTPRTQHPVPEHCNGLWLTLIGQAGPGGRGAGTGFLGAARGGGSGGGGAGKVGRMFVPRAALGDTYSTVVTPSARNDTGSAAHGANTEFWSGDFFAIAGGGRRGNDGPTGNNWTAGAAGGTTAISPPLADPGPAVLADTFARPDTVAPHSPGPGWALIGNSQAVGIQSNHAFPAAGTSAYAIIVRDQEMPGDDMYVEGQMNVTGSVAQFFMVPVNLVLGVAGPGSTPWGDGVYLQFYAIENRWQLRRFNNRTNWTGTIATSTTAGTSGAGQTLIAQWDRAADHTQDWMGLGRLGNVYYAFHNGNVVGTWEDPRTAVIGNSPIGGYAPGFRHVGLALIGGAASSRMRNWRACTFAARPGAGFTPITVAGANGGNGGAGANNNVAGAGGDSADGCPGGGGGAGMGAGAGDMGTSGRGGNSATALGGAAVPRGGGNGNLGQSGATPGDPGGGGSGGASTSNGGGLPGGNGGAAGAGGGGSSGTYTAQTGVQAGGNGGKGASVLEWV